MAIGNIKNIGGGGGVKNKNIRYLYNKGDICTKYTGDWVARRYGQYTDGERSNPVVTQENLEMRISQGSVQYSNYGAMGCGTSSLVDISDYTELHMRYSVSGGTEKEIIVDLSEVTGSYYIGAYLNYHESSANDFVGLLISNETSGMGTKYVMEYYKTEKGYTHSSQLHIYEIWLEKADVIWDAINNGGFDATVKSASPSGSVTFNASIQSPVLPNKAKIRALVQCVDVWATIYVSTDNGTTWKPYLATNQNYPRTTVIGDLSEYAGEQVLIRIQAGNGDNVTNQITLLKCNITK